MVYLIWKINENENLEAPLITDVTKKSSGDLEPFLRNFFWGVTSRYVMIKHIFLQEWGTRNANKNDFAFSSSKCVIKYSSQTVTSILRKQKKSAIVVPVKFNQ